MVEEAKKRDHRKLGQELDLFSIQEQAGIIYVYIYSYIHVLERLSFWRAVCLSVCVALWL